MCKGITSRGKRCQGGLGLDYCRYHDPSIPGINLSSSLNSIKFYFHWEVPENNDNRIIRIREEFLQNYTSEESRRHLFEDVMPFLRDCWKYGYPGTDRFQPEVLITHFSAPGVRRDLRMEQLPRVWTEAQRQARMAPPQPIRQPILQRHNADAIGDIPANQIIRQQIPNPVPNLIPNPFADSQNVHRTSVNESVIKSVKIICSVEWKKESWPILSKNGEKLPLFRTLLEKVYLWNTNFSLEEKETQIWQKLYPILSGNSINHIWTYEDEIFGKKPWVVLYKTFNWIFQQPVNVQKDALIRLLDELYDGREMCIAGKVSRIINSLVGIHPEIHVGLSGKEMLQERMSALAKRGGMEPEQMMEEGRVILRDANVSEEEWDVWLEPLLLI